MTRLPAVRLQVTNENKREYVDLVAEHRMTTAIRAQTLAFLKGYWEMVPKVGSRCPLLLIRPFGQPECAVCLQALQRIHRRLCSRTLKHFMSAGRSACHRGWAVPGCRYILYHAQHKLNA
jgi:hypothetical protein